MELPKSSMMRRRLERVPALSTFFKNVAATCRPENDDSFFECAPHFASLLQEDFLAMLLNSELDSLCKEPSHIAERSGETGMALFMAGRVSLTLNLYPANREQASLVALAEHHMVGVLGPTPLHIDRWRQPSPWPNDLLDRTKRLEVMDPIRVLPGETTAFRAAEDIIFTRAEGAPSLVLGFTLHDVTPIRWRYNTASLLPDRAIASDLSTSRLEFAAAVLAHLGDKSDAPALDTLSRHPAHSVRWAAVRRMMQLDPMRALRFLQRAASDSHPHVKSAAVRALKRLDAEIQVSATQV